MTTDFDGALIGSIPLLRELPRERTAIPEARQRFGAFLRTHPMIQGDIVAELEPGKVRTEYDLLLEHPEGGTVCVCYRPDTGSPWLADYAEHWAANYVLSIGEAHLTVQDALCLFQLAGEEHEGMLRSLVEYVIVRQAVEEYLIDSDSQEIQQAADAIRAGRRLHSAEATHTWLRALGWSEHQFFAMVSGGVQARKLRERVTQGRLEEYFAGHRSDFDILRVIRAEVPDGPTADRLAVGAERDGLLAAAQTTKDVEVEFTLRSARAGTLPAEIAGAGVGAVIGPLISSNRSMLAQVLERHPAVWDDATREAVCDVVFREWLTRRLTGTTIRWHWI